MDVTPAVGQEEGGEEGSANKEEIHDAATTPMMSPSSATEEEKESSKPTTSRRTHPDVTIVTNIRHHRDNNQISNREGLVSPRAIAMYYQQQQRRKKEAASPLSASDELLLRHGPLPDNSWVQAKTGVSSMYMHPPPVRRRRDDQEYSPSNDGGGHYAMNVESIVSPSDDHYQQGQRQQRHQEEDGTTAATSSTPGNLRGYSPRRSVMDGNTNGGVGSCGMLVRRQATGGHNMNAVTTREVVGITASADESGDGASGSGDNDPIMEIVRVFRMWGADVNHLLHSPQMNRFLSSSHRLVFTATHQSLRAILSSPPVSVPVSLTRGAIHQTNGLVNAVQHNVIPTILDGVGYVVDSTSRAAIDLVGHVVSESVQLGTSIWDEWRGGVLFLLSGGRSSGGGKSEQHHRQVIGFDDREDEAEEAAADGATDVCADHADDDDGAGAGVNATASASTVRGGGGGAVVGYLFVGDLNLHVIEKPREDERGTLPSIETPSPPSSKAAAAAAAVCAAAAAKRRVIFPHAAATGNVESPSRRLQEVGEEILGKAGELQQHQSSNDDKGNTMGPRRNSPLSVLDYDATLLSSGDSNTRAELTTTTTSTTPGGSGEEVSDVHRQSLPPPPHSPSRDRSTLASSPSIEAGSTEQQLYVAPETPTKKKPIVQQRKKRKKREWLALVQRHASGVEGHSAIATQNDGIEELVQATQALHELARAYCLLPSSEKSAGGNDGVTAEGVTVPAQPSSCCPIPSYTPDKSTQRHLKRMANDPSMRVPTLEKEVMVWTGKLTPPPPSALPLRSSSLSNADYYDVPVFKIQCIVNIPPFDLAKLFLDSDRATWYNKWSLGRTDEEVYQVGLHTNAMSTCPQHDDGRAGTEMEGGDADVGSAGSRRGLMVGEIKIVKNSTKVPFTDRPMVMRTLVHGRPIPPTCTDGEGCGAGTDIGEGYLIVSRSVLNRKRNQSGGTTSNGSENNGDDGDPKSEVMIGVNYLQPVAGHPHKTEMVAISHVKASWAPKFLQHKVGVMGLMEFVKKLKEMADKDEWRPLARDG